jgi:UDP-N-acetylglucosamine diphosphorylase/glucosamine-1-phosphate N-acetyltransferase
MPFFPLSLSQPVFDLRIGFHTLRSRMHDEFAGVELHTLCRDYLADITRIKTPDVKVNETPEQETLFVNARLLCLDDELKAILERVEENTIAVKGGYVVAARLGPESAVDFAGYITERIGEDSMARLCEALRELSPAKDEAAPAAKAEAAITKQDADVGTFEDEHAVGEDAKEEKLPKALTGLIKTHELTRVELPEARLLSFPWQLVGFNSRAITDDFNKLPFRGESEESVTYPGVHIIGEDSIVIGEGAVIKSGAVLDATDGPIAIGDRTIVMSNACIVGPASIGADCIVRAGAKILKGTSTGRVCKIGGEIEGTIISSYSNKQHDGFIGHSYLGEWVNIGAASNNSDLKNNYSKIRMWCQLQHLLQRIAGKIRAELLLGARHRDDDLRHRESNANGRGRPRTAQSQVHRRPPQDFQEDFRDARPDEQEHLANTRRDAVVETPTGNTTQTEEITSSRSALGGVASAKSVPDDPPAVYRPKPLKR